MRSPFHHLPPSRRAVVLIMTLWVVLVLTLLAHSLAFDMQVEMRLAATFRDRFIVEQLTRVGVAQAIADLRNDRLLEQFDVRESDTESPVAFTPDPAKADHFADIWNGKSIEPRLVELGSPQSADDDTPNAYEIMVVDEESKLNINSTSEDMPRAIQYLLMELFVEQHDAMLISLAITDWKDEDGKASTPEEQGESAYYTKLAADLESGNRMRPAGWTFQPKNGPFGSVEELLQIPGITPELFYGSAWEDSQLPAFFPERPLKQYSSHDRPGLRDLVTISADGLNINTASLPVLTAVFAAASDNADTGRTAATAIIRHRGTDPSGYSPDTIFKHLDDLNKVEGFDASMKANIDKVTPLTVSSNRFIIYCRAGYHTRRRGSFSSLDRGREKTIQATARAIVQCRRDLMTFSMKAGEARQGAIVGSRIPGFPKEAKSASDILGSTGRAGWERLIEGNIEDELWSIPVVYIESWQTF